MKYAIIEPSVGHSSTFSWWQSPLWRDILIESAQACEVFYFGNIDHYILVEIRSIGLGQYGAFVLWVSRDQLGNDRDSLIAELSDMLRKRGVLFLHIEPIDESWEWRSENTEVRIEPYRNFLTPHTRTLDLSKSRETLFAEMHEKGRYNIKIAEKRGIATEHVDATSANVDIWMDLLTETTLRDRFAQNSRRYYEIFLQTLQNHDLGWLVFARYEGRVIAAGIFVYLWDTAIYYYWASTTDREMRKYMASYLLQWDAILEWQRRWCRVYDFLGVADPSDPSDPLSWVSEFKSRFGGEVIALPPKFLISLSWRGRVFLVLQRLRKRCF
jgi:FemAB family